MEKKIILDLTPNKWDKVTFSKKWIKFCCGNITWGPGGGGNELPV